MGGDANFVGIDIGSSGVRVVQVKRSGGKPLLVTYGDAEVPLAITQSDAQVDRDKLAEAISGLLQTAGVSAKQAIIGIPSMKMFATVVSVPRMSKQELDNAIRYQAEQIVPMPLDQAKLDWSVVEGTSQTSNEMDVMVVATPIQIAQKYHDLAAKAGLELVGLEPTVLAMSRAVVRSSENAVIVMDMGGLTTDLAIIHQGVPKLIRSVLIGGLSFAKAVAQYLAVTEEQARQFITKFGLTSDKLEGQVLNSLKPSVDNLISEVQVAVQEFSSHHPGVKIEKIVVTGGASAIPQLPAFIANGTKLPVEIGNPWQDISYPANLSEKLQGVAHTYAVASGLAQMEVA